MRVRKYLLNSTDIQTNSYFENKSGDLRQSIIKQQIGQIQLPLAYIITEIKDPHYIHRIRCNTKMCVTNISKA